MRAKYRLRQMSAAACAAMVCCSGLSALAGGYVSAVTNTPGLRHFWLLDEPGTPAVSSDIVGGKTATHMNGFPPSTAGAGPVSTEGPRPTDGFAGMATDNAALLYSIAGKTRSFVSDPDQLGTKSFAAGDMHGLSTEFWFKRSAINNEGVMLGYNDTTGFRYGFTATTIIDTKTSIREIRVFNKDAAERQTGYQLGATPDLQWHHMVMTWDGRNLRTYLDGAEPASSVALCASGLAIGPIQQMDELVFGGDASTMDIRYLNGALDKVAIYDRPLTDAQVARHYQAAVTGKPAARAVLRRHGGASLLKHLRKRFESLPADHPAWDELGYFEKRKDNMRYGEYRKQGLFIGSGVVEAACRTDVARRCKQSGMHWRFHNAAAICALTARFRSHLPAA